MPKILFCLFLFSSVALAYQPEHKPDNDWSIIRQPTQDTAKPIGSYANGCMSGAIALPPSGIGYVDMRRNRNRYYGQPELISFIKALGRFTAQRYGQKHLIGDLSQPRGGPMNFGHSSHQIGLDVDIWMQTVAENQTVSPYRNMQTIVNKATGSIRSRRIESPIRDALYFTANYPDVARIFVNPVVKSYLCRTEANTNWLNKLRPWWGHDQHFHVRLLCPLGSVNCKNQKPPPPTDGCNTGLSHWVNEQSDLVTGHVKPKKTPKKPKRKPKILPAYCQFIQTQ
ncbi:MAG: penicillin-insensitive murein endopeptidase [Ostreibacterium sp.]